MTSQDRPGRARRGPSRDLADAGLLLALAMARDRVARARSESDAAIAERDRVAAAAHAAGLSIREVAIALGVSKPAAQQAIDRGRRT